MLKEEDILSTLDGCTQLSPYAQFISLGHPYWHLIDCRLNIFKGDDDRWAIAAERLGYSERGGALDIEITYIGNCLQNLEVFNEQLTNVYTVYPVDGDTFYQTNDGFYLYPDADYWMVNGNKIYLSTNKQDYIDNDIDLIEYEPGQIHVYEAARLVIVKQRDLFRASDADLYKSIPADLKKILVLDEWYHRDFIQIEKPAISNEHLKRAYDMNKQSNGLQDISFETFLDMYGNQMASNLKADTEQRDNNSPSLYETWQMIAKVIVTGDISYYKPTIAPNTHWKNWPESGSL